MNLSSGKVGVFIGIVCSVCSEEECPSSSVGKWHLCLEVVGARKRGSLPTPSGDDSSTSLIGSGYFLFVAISTGDSSLGYSQSATTNEGLLVKK